MYIVCYQITLLRYNSSGVARVTVNRQLISLLLFMAKLMIMKTVGALLTRYFF